MKRTSRSEPWTALRQNLCGPLPRFACFALMASAISSTQAYASQPISLHVGPDTVRLVVGSQAYWFRRDSAGQWTSNGVDVAGMRVADSLSFADSFMLGSGTGNSFAVERDDAAEKRIRFHLAHGEVTYSVKTADRLPLLHIAIAGFTEPTVAWRTAVASPEEHGAWVTRGETAADAES